MAEWRRAYNRSVSETTAEPCSLFCISIATHAALAIQIFATILGFLFTLCRLGLGLYETLSRL